MKKIGNFSDIGNLDHFLSAEKSLSLFLGKIALNVWTGAKAVSDFELHESQLEEAVAKHLIKYGADGHIEFTDELHFEFFLSLHFLESLQLSSVTKMTEIINSLQKKQWPRSSNSKLTLSDDFQAICLINIHNYYNLNLFRALIDEFDSCFQQLNWSFDRALPYFHVAPGDLYRFLEFVQTREGNSFIPGIANAVMELCKIQPTVAVELLQMVDTSLSEQVKGITPAILNGLTAAKGVSYTLPLIIGKMNSEYSYDVKIGLFVLSKTRISETEWHQFGITLSELLTRFEHCTDDEYRFFLPAIHLAQWTHIPTASKSLISYSESKNRQIQLALSDILWLRASDFYNDSWYERCLLNSARWDYNDISIGTNMSHCLLRLVEKNPALSIKYLDCWIANEDNHLAKLKLFRNEITTLFLQNKEIAEDWFTRSFRATGERFHKAMAAIVSDLWVSGFRGLSLNKKVLNTYSYAETKYVLFKILGYVHDKESLESLVFSILEKEPFDPNTAQLAVTAFMEYICYNYGGTYTYLKEKEQTASNTVKGIVTGILEWLDQYTGAIREIRTINELKWQNRQNVNFAQIRMKKMTEKYTEGMNGSNEFSLRSFFTNVSMKGGRKFFSKAEDRYTDSVPLQRFESTFELPIGEIIDPVREIMKRIEWKKYELES